MRHHFASVCVMAGVPFRQVAAWLGHKDGGVLVGKIYGHLDPDFGQGAARKVSFRLGDLSNAPGPCLRKQTDPPRPSHESQSHS